MPRPVLYMARSSIFDRGGVGHEDTRDGAQNHGLARTGAPDECQQLVLNLQRDARSTVLRRVSIRIVAFIAQAY